MAMQSLKEEKGAGAVSKFLVCWPVVTPIPSILSTAKSWCDISTVPRAERVPAKLRGLFWMKMVATSDLNVCMSLGRWNPKTLTMTLHVYESFTWAVNPLGLGAQQNMLGAYYIFKFDSPKLTKAVITLQGRGPGSFVFQFFVAGTMYHTMEETDGNAHPGDVWFRRIADPATGLLTYPLFASYYLVRVLDADMNPTDRASEFNMLAPAKMLSRGAIATSVMKCNR